MRELKRIWYLDNKEHRDNYIKNFQQNNKDKVKLYNKKHQHKNHNITDVEWINCKNYFNNTCAYCGLPLDQHWVPYAGKMILSDFHKEHLVHDGSNKLKNCVPACKSCNSQKWGFTFNEWYNPSNPRYDLEKYYKICKWVKEDYKKFSRHTFRKEDD